MKPQLLKQKPKKTKVKESKGKESKGNNIPPISPDEKNGGGGQIISEEIPIKKINPDDFITIPCDQIQKKYNEICKKLTPVSSLTFSRRNKVIERWRENPSLEFWENIFRKANDVCLSNGWKPTFDWIFNDDTNYIKILEGNFDNIGGNNGKGSGYSKTNPQEQSDPALDEYDLRNYVVN